MFYFSELHLTSTEDFLLLRKLLYFSKHYFTSPKSISLMTTLCYYVTSFMVVSLLKNTLHFSPKPLASSLHLASLLLMLFYFSQRFSTSPNGVRFSERCNWCNSANHISGYDETVYQLLASFVVVFESDCFGFCLFLLTTFQKQEKRKSKSKNKGQLQTFLLTHSNQSKTNEQQRMNNRIVETVNVMHNNRLFMLQQTFHTWLFILRCSPGLLCFECVSEKVWQLLIRFWLGLALLLLLKSG